MCGITGVLRAEPDTELERCVRRMSDSLYRRGPDDGGVWVDDTRRLGFGHRRLSIVELSPAGHQPMLSACGRFVIAFNGEIYNHLEMRSELEAASKAPLWRGHSDTETLLAGVAEWGLEEILRRAVGMFAIAVWDRRTQTLQLARDRFGEKPLYYGWVKGAFVFGSELKALRAYPGFDSPIDRDALALYFSFRAIPAPYSIFQGIFKLQPGCLLTLPIEQLANRSPQIKPFWSLAAAVRKSIAQPIADEREAISSLESILGQAIGAQSVADVPLGAFLSGGVDSSLIVALMQAQSARPVQTFTIGFDEAGYDESRYAKKVADHLGTEHHELRIGADDARAVIPSLPDLYDEPFSDSSQIPTHLVCRAARTKVTVALSGDGGDESFAGYNRHFLSGRIWNRLGPIPFPLRQALATMASGLSEGTWDRVGRVLSGRRKVPQFGTKIHKLAHNLRSARGLDDLYRSFVGEWPLDSNIVIGARQLPTQLDDAALVAGIDSFEHRMMLWDTLTYLPDDILTKVDRAAMGVSLETRAPFLDHRVVEHAWRLPLHMKIRDGQGKWALRQILYKYVPRELIERPKAGFAIPVGDWLRGPLREWAESLLDEQRIQQQGWLNPVPITTIWRDHLSGHRDWTSRLWTILMFQAWLIEPLSNKTASIP